MKRKTLYVLPELAIIYYKLIGISYNSFDSKERNKAKNRFTATLKKGKLDKVILREAIAEYAKRITMDFNL